MSVKSVSVKLNNGSTDNNVEAKTQQKPRQQYLSEQMKNQNDTYSKNVSFNGLSDGIILFMDGIERGGFVASFLAQDCCGMVFPRIWEGLNRNKEETGHFNWDFAKREGLRECLSGPSVFVIPWVMLSIIKKYSGTANNVNVDYIKAFGEEFAKFATDKKLKTIDKSKTQKEFYEQIYKNVIKTSTNGELSEVEVEKYAKQFAQELLNIENAKSKGFWKNLSNKPVSDSKEDLMHKLSAEFVSLRKKHTTANTPQWFAEFSTGVTENGGSAKKLSATFAAFSHKLIDYTNDVVGHADKLIQKDRDANLIEFVKSHTNRRMGSRAITNISMWLAVVGFYFMIPKIYNMGLGGKNPGIAGLEQETPVVATTDETKATTSETDKEKLSFNGREKIFTAVAENLRKDKIGKKISNFFEFDGASMTINSTLALLFGFCLPTRLANSTDHHDRKEIMTRDLFSFISILFGAKALSRVFSKIFAAFSGLALNLTPDDHNKNIFYKFKNYVTPSGGIGVLSSDEIVAKYSNVQDYKEGINGFFHFVEENGGNLKRMLAIDPNIRDNAEKIIGGKLEKVENNQIAAKFKEASSKGSTNLDAIYEILKDPNNKLVKRAKTLNSSFGAASIVLLVPLFMIWLARHCERMTKSDITKEKFQEIAKCYMNEDFASADVATIRALDAKVLADVKANKIYGYRYDAEKNIIKDLTGKEKQISDVRVEIKKYVDLATPKGQQRKINKTVEQPTEIGNDYQLFLTSQNQLKENFLTK